MEGGVVVRVVVMVVVCAQVQGVCVCERVSKRVRSTRRIL